MTLELTESERALLKSAVRLNMFVTAASVGLIAGGLLWLATTVLVLRGGENVGAHLGVLAVYFPGYAVTWPGAWIGFLWAFVAGAIGGAVLYWSYARTLRTGALNQVLAHSEATPGQPPTLLISGHSLGVGVGVCAGLQLIVATSWLVMRGTAAYSENAALVGQYLPGYTVSIPGSLIGALELFVLAYCAARIFSGIYNTIARSRLRQSTT
jgi:hypothetical protein